MGMLETLLGKFSGDVKLIVQLRDKHVAEILVEKQQIVVDVKNPILAVEALIGQLNKKKVESGTLNRLKKMGFSVKVRYKGLEFSL